jgi:hypothetical protein
VKRFGILLTLLALLGVGFRVYRDRHPRYDITVHLVQPDGSVKTQHCQSLRQLHAVLLGEDSR